MKQNNQQCQKCKNHAHTFPVEMGSATIQITACTQHAEEAIKRIETKF